MKTLWIAINYIGKSDIGIVFDIKGLFSSKTKAKAACKKDTEGFGPITINEVLPEKIMTWPDFEYPWRPK